MALLLFFLSEQLINMIGDSRAHNKKLSSKKAPVELALPGEVGEPDDDNNTTALVDSGLAAVNLPVPTVVPTSGVGHAGPQVRVVLSGHRASERSFGRERLCKHKYSSFCVDDVYDAKNGPPPSHSDQQLQQRREIATLMAGADTTDTLLQAATSDGNFTLVKEFHIFKHLIEFRRDTEACHRHQRYQGAYCYHRQRQL